MNNMEDIEFSLHNIYLALIMILISLTDGWLSTLMMVLFILELVNFHLKRWLKK